MKFKEKENEQLVLEKTAEFLSAGAFAAGTWTSWLRRRDWRKIPYTGSLAQRKS